MLLVLNMFWIYHSFKCVRVTQGSKYAWICLNDSWVCPIAFDWHSPIVIPYLKESQTVFLESKNLLFSIVAGSIWFCFLFLDGLFTIKVSNLLLPLGAERAWGFESYPITEVPNKYIYCAFFMIYLSILLLLFFSLFDTSKELIGDSQRLWVCSFVRL